MPYPLEINRFLACQFSVDRPNPLPLKLAKSLPFRRRNGGIHTRPPSRGIGRVLPLKQSVAVPGNHLMRLDRISSSSWNTWSHTDQKPRETALCRIVSRICGVSFCPSLRRASSATPHASRRFNHLRSRSLKDRWPGTLSSPVSAIVRSAIGLRAGSKPVVIWGGWSTTSSRFKSCTPSIGGSD